MTFFKTACAGLMLSLFVPSLAHAQFARDNKAPIDATADDIMNSGGITTLSGQVDVRQGDTRILADTMKIYTGANTGVVSATGDIDRIEAIGNFYYITPDQEVRGEQGIYTQSLDTFTVTGDVILLQGENIVTGDKLIYNLKTEQAQVIGSCKGRRCGSKGRVSILIKNSNVATPAQ